MVGNKVTKLIVGLGNPGQAYQNSRHNIGFSAVTALAKAFGALFKKDRGTFSLSAKINIGNQPVILAMPVTFMNLSGIAAKALLKKYKISRHNLLVVCDDLDLDFGRIKLKLAGSSGGHRGLQSIIDYLAAQQFNRLRIGIGRPAGDLEPVDYVLSNFTKQEKERLKEILGAANRCCQIWAEEEINAAMNVFNKRS